MSKPTLQTHVYLTSQRIIEPFDHLDTVYRRERAKSRKKMDTHTVDFPHPDCPTSAMKVPGSIWRFRSRRTRTPGRVGYLKCTFSKRICPRTSVGSIRFPSVDSASISGTESNNLMMSVAAPLAEDMSGTNEKTFPAWMELKVLHCSR